MPVLSCGIVVWRRGASSRVDVLLGHMGGPYWERRDDGAWSIPKGLADVGEAPIDAARREFCEELGLALPAGELVELGQIRQSTTKSVAAWALEVEGDGGLDLGAVQSNTFEIEWPPRSGRVGRFPEIDRAAWFDIGTARSRIVKGQVQLLDRLTKLVL